MLNASFFQILCLFIYILFLIYMIRRAFPLKTQVLYSCVYLYFVMVVSLAIFPVFIDKNLISQYAAEEEKIRMNFIPFASIYKLIERGDFYLISRTIGGNIILLLPLGFLLPLISEKLSDWGKVAFAGLLLGIVIQLIRVILSLIYGFSYRPIDIDNIILNLIGCCGGYLLFLWARKAFQWAKNSW